MPKLNEFLSIGQAAEYLGVSKDTLRRWDRSGKLSAHRHPVTQFRLYLKEDLDAVLSGLPRSDSEGRTERKSATKMDREAR